MFPNFVSVVYNIIQSLRTRQSGFWTQRQLWRNTVYCCRHKLSSNSTMQWIKTFNPQMLLWAHLRQAKERLPNCPGFDQSDWTCKSSLQTYEDAINGKLFIGHLGFWADDKNHTFCMHDCAVNLKSYSWRKLWKLDLNTSRTSTFSVAKAHPAPFLTLFVFPTCCRHQLQNENIFFETVMKLSHFQHLFCICAIFSFI